MENILPWSISKVVWCPVGTFATCFCCKIVRRQKLETSEDSGQPADTDREWGWAWRYPPSSRSSTDAAPPGRQPGRQPDGVDVLVTDPPSANSSNRQKPPLHNPLFYIVAISEPILILRIFIGFKTSYKKVKFCQIVSLLASTIRVGPIVSNSFKED